MLYYVNTKYILAAVAILQQLVQSLKTLRCLTNAKKECIRTDSILQGRIH